MFTKELSLRERIIKYARRLYPAFINGGELERLALENGFKSSNASRRARELENDKILKAELRKNYETGTQSVWYQYNPSERELIHWSFIKKI